MNTCFLARYGTCGTPSYSAVSWGLYLLRAMLPPAAFLPVRALFLDRLFRVTPEIETADLSQSHVGLNFGVIGYFI